MKTESQTGCGVTRSAVTKTMIIILAGGQSSRMGTDKASLLLGGKRMVDVMVDRSADLVGVENVLVSGDCGRSNCIRDINPLSGPVEGVRSVLRWLMEESQVLPDQVLIVPVDMPRLGVQQMAAIVEGSIPEMARVFDGYELPLLLKVSCEVLETIERLCGEQTPRRERSFRRLLELLRVETRCVSLVGETALVNTNTPLEWKEAIG